MRFPNAAKPGSVSGAAVQEFPQSYSSGLSGPEADLPKASSCVSPENPPGPTASYACSLREQAFFW